MLTSVDLAQALREPLFVLRCGDQVWQLWADGSALGFPPGTVIDNRALPILAALQALAGEKQFPDPLIADQEAQSHD